ncbi:hypothetical protein PSHT_08111 [Puccinia striiformis]|uniref:Uncharacterized protein n=1 Tax=Puccinia striiformis TaxID=27350 RepID=A0A2S4VS60_9BASI|nr:hypothetical protein PSHT_08111 [Puccinia striiformis]
MRCMTNRLRRVAKVYELRSKSSLVKLPAELILLIAQQLLAPALAISQPEQPADDLLNLASTCKTIHSLLSILTQHQFTIVITNDNLSQATNRIQQLSQQNSIKKLVIKDQGSTSIDRQIWFSNLNRTLQNQLSSIEFLTYSRNLESVTQSSPYDLLPIDHDFIQSITKLKKLKNLYLSGLELSTDQAGNDDLLPSTLENLHLIAVDDSILTIIKRSPNLKDLRIWRDFLIGYPDVNHWLTDLQWSTLHNLSLKGFYGNSVIGLQASLRENRSNISNEAIEINLKSLDLDEPYSTQGLLLLLEAFKSPILISLKIILWKDTDFNPSLFQKIALKFPNLQDLQVVLETPLKRWWPYKLYSWAESLKNFKQLKKLKWNCSPFPSHDYIQIQAGMKSQVMILASLIPTLERVSYLDISGWLEIERITPIDDKSEGSLIKSIKWTGVQFSYPFLACHEFFNDDNIHRESEAQVVLGGSSIGQEDSSRVGESNQNVTLTLKDRSDREGGSSTKKILVYDPFSAQPSSSTTTDSSRSPPPNSSASALQSSSSTFKSSSLRTSSCPRIVAANIINLHRSRSSRSSSVTQSSPYSQLSIDHHLMQCITKLKKLKNLYLSGIRLLSSTIQTGSKLLTSTLEILNLIAWSTLHHLSLKGLYGNPDIRLQASLGLLPLLEALKSHILISLKIILWLFQKIALKFPNLQDLQYPWAESLTSLKKLKKLKWNCSPFPLHDYIQIQAVIKSQVMILESRITTLIEQVLYLDISG